jgi:hypothetical protein
VSLNKIRIREDGASALIKRQILESELVSQMIFGNALLNFSI